MPAALSATVVDQLNNLGVGFPPKRVFRLGDELQALIASSPDLSQRTVLFDDFLPDAFPGNKNFRAFGAGGSVVAAILSGSFLQPNTCGVVGTQVAALNAEATLYQDPVSCPVGQGVIEVEWRVRFSILTPDVSNDYAIRVGFGSTLSFVTPTDGAFFRIDRASNGLNWVFEVFRGGGSIIVNSTIPAPFGSYQKLRLTTDASANAYSFYIDDVLVNQIDASALPASTGRIGPMTQMKKLAGTAARSFATDWCAFSFSLTR
jgi:hypothetical protein